MKIEYRESFKKDLLRITDKKLLGRIAMEIKRVQDANNLSEIPDLKRLRGKGNHFRIRLGNFRIGLLFPMILFLDVQAQRSLL